MMFFKPKPKPEHQKYWVNYMALVNDNLSSILTDYGLGTIAPVNHYDRLAWFWLHFKDPEERGFYKNEEFRQLVEIEEHLEKMLQQKLKPICAGSITGAGRREFYYYLTDSKKFEDIAEEVMKDHPNYQYQIGFKQDEKWEHYFNVLYPTTKQLRTFKDSLVLDALRDNGDNLTEKRLVSHWSYFPNESLRAKFVEEITTQGFEVQEDGFSYHKDEELPYGVAYDRVDKVDEQSISEVTIPLLKLSQSHQGEYDGWETFVVNPKDARQE